MLNACPIVDCLFAYLFVCVLQFQIILREIGGYSKKKQFNIATQSELLLILQMSQPQNIEH